MAVTRNERGVGQIVNSGKDSCPTPYLQTSDRFSLADIAHILKVPQPRLRNWSSIRICSGADSSVLSARKSAHTSSRQCVPDRPSAQV
jgi:hypothetical protein